MGVCMQHYIACNESALLWIVFWCNLLTQDQKPYQLRRQYWWDYVGTNAIIEPAYESHCLSFIDP